jgi:hypothetical protein
MLTRFALAANKGTFVNTDFHTYLQGQNYPEKVKEALEQNEKQKKLL